jgi:hypothetical protein
LLDLIINRNNLKYSPIKYKIGDDLLEVDVIEYGYSFEFEKHFIKFLIKGLDQKNQEKVIEIIQKIPIDDLKRFNTDQTEKGMIVLELFPENEYPFNTDIPNDDEIIDVEDTVKGFLEQFS